MANRFQKFLFNLSTMFPLVFILALVYWIEQEVPPLINGENGELQLVPQSIFLMSIMLVSVFFPCIVYFLLEYADDASSRSQ